MSSSGCCAQGRGSGRGAAKPGSRRFELYRAAARALNRFYEQWTSPFCLRCLEVTRGYHRDDPRADVELVEGLFPGCCHAGVGEALWIPGCQGDGRFPPRLRALFEKERSAFADPLRKPAAYRVRERGTGLVARGVACAYLDPSGCALGALKGPLCLTYLCDAVREALAEIGGWGVVGTDSGDFCGSREALREVVGGSLGSAERQVRSLRIRLRDLDRKLSEWQPAAGEALHQFWERRHELREAVRAGVRLPDEKS
jgi:hypothetical protein